jgi:hypothetical protein
MVKQIGYSNTWEYIIQSTDFEFKSDMCIIILYNYYAPYSFPIIQTSFQVMYLNTKELRHH